MSYGAERAFARGLLQHRAAADEIRVAGGSAIGCFRNAQLLAVFHAGEHCFLCAFGGQRQCPAADDDEQ